MKRVDGEVLVVGGGPAGAAAAEAAGPHAVLLDAHPLPGGQIWRRGARSGEHTGTRVVASLGSGAVLAEAEDGPAVFSFRRLILATGARERFLPFPGWTLPGVTGAGGLQLLVKGGLSVAGQTVVVGGTGPLLLATAATLRRHGATVSLIAEQAPGAQVRAFATGLAREPAKLRQAAGLRWGVRGTRYRTGCWVRRALGATHLQAVDVTDGRRTWTVPCDFLACGYGLVPNTELARHLGCATDHGTVLVNEWQETSVSDVYCAGGIADLQAARIEGRIAGLAATGRHHEARALFPARDRAHRFGARMARAFALRPELRGLAEPETVVCRCEEVSMQALQEHSDWRAAKLQTRYGMGPCQGRVCGEAARFLFGWEPDGVRPPVTAARIGTLAHEEVP